MLHKLTAILLLLLVFTAAVHAQATCPPAVLIDLARSSSTCYDLANESVCLGNGSATVENAAALPGDRFAASTLRTLTLTSTADELAVAYAAVRANLSAADQNRAALMLFGDATLTNEVDFPTVTINVVARGTVNIRRLPANDADVLERLGVNDGVSVDGRSADGLWLRTLLNGTQSGWLTVEGVNVQGDINTLALIDPAAEVVRPLQYFTLTTAGSTFCDGAFASGLLVQTPNLEDAVLLRVNGVALALTGTFFIQAHADLTVYALHGQGMVGDIFVPAGAWVAGSGNAEPYDLADVSGLPISHLPNSIQIAAPVTVEQIDAARQAYLAAQQIAAATPIPVTPVDTTCRRTVTRLTTLYGGPGDFYEAVNDIAEGTRITPILQTTDPDGNLWWQLASSNWILANRVEQTGMCADIPVSQVAPIPTTNTLSLETCESSNGALRAGQTVTIQFTPPPFDNYGEARDAQRIDPGRIIIGAQRYRPQVSEPIRLGTVDERYLRRFYIVWVAEPGTYRIEGDRLHYTPICTITVPVG